MAGVFRIVGQLMLSLIEAGLKRLGAHDIRYSISWRVLKYKALEARGGYKHPSCSAEPSNVEQAALLDLAHTIGFETRLSFRLVSDKR